MQHIFLRIQARRNIKRQQLSGVFPQCLRLLPHRNAVQIYNTAIGQIIGMGFIQLQPVFDCPEIIANRNNSCRLNSALYH